MFRAKNSSGNDEVDVQKVEKIAPVYNLVTKPCMYGANRRAMTVTAKPLTTAVAGGFAWSNNNRQPAAASLMHGGAVTKEFNKYIEHKKRQFNQRAISTDQYGKCFVYSYIST